MTAFDVTQSRNQFPALSITDEGRARVYFDNPAGTQVPRQVIDRTVDCLTSRNANLGGYFTTTREAGDLVDEAHQACADFYNAASAREIVFGQNMTTLTLHMSRCLGRQFKAGDEIVLSRMDHDANIAPWLLLATPALPWPTTATRRPPSLSCANSASGTASTAPPTKMTSNGASEG